MKHKVYKLKPYDSHKSFYGKAIVTEVNGYSILKSYDTEVAYIDREGGFHRLWAGYSATTMRHINAFICTCHNNLERECTGKAWWVRLPVESLPWVTIYCMTA